MSNIFLIHGSYGDPDENWLPWLKSELEKISHRVFIPRFPVPPAQSIDSWLKTFKAYKQQLDENSIMIGHSLGPAFILNVLEKIDHPIKAVFCLRILG